MVPPTHPYAAFLRTVNKPARYTGGEVGAVRKDWHSVQTRICLAFPDVYDIGMSHLGLRILYDVLARDERTLGERAYCPWPDMERALRERGLPLISLENYRPLCEFDVVGFSLQFELTFTNLLTMLDLGGIALRAAERRESAPLVVGGGPGATHPEPVAPFFDALVIGDGEEKLPEVALTWSRLRTQGVARAERLRRLAELGGVYVPALYRLETDRNSGHQVVARPEPGGAPYPVRRALVDLAAHPFPVGGPVGGPEAVFDRASIEIARGCTEGCRFCQAGMIYRPLRERDPGELRRTVVETVRRSGSDEVSLTALSTADVSFIEPLVRQLGPELAEQRVSLAVSSLRAYGLAPELLDELRRVRAAGLTFAPEAGSQRLRDVVNKNVTEAQLEQTAEQVFARGFDRMKLYFMLGLPTEGDEDLEAIVQVAARTAAIGRRVAGRRVQVTVSVSTHVPKPHTPFQWEAMDNLTEIERKQRLLRVAARPHRQLRLRTHDARGSVLEGILARGDRRLADVVEHAWRAGARFDAWDEHFVLARWQRALEASGLAADDYLAARTVSGRLPWDHIDVGLEPGFLPRERRRAHAERPSPPCGKPARASEQRLAPAADDEQKLVCYHCGVACDLEAIWAERRQHLGTPGAAGASHSAAADPREPAVPHAGDPRAGHRYRLVFEKLGTAALLGHLDLVRELPRVLRRAGVTQVYTGGFHPKPDMRFAPALSLGVLSLDERVDVRLTESLDEPALGLWLEAMNSASPAGLRFVGAQALAPADAALSRVLCAARYLIAFSPEQLARAAAADAASGPSWLAARCERLLAAESLVVERERKGRIRHIDVRPFVRALSVLRAGREAWLLRVGLPPDRRCVVAELTVGGQGSARLAELAALLLGSEPPIDHAAVRLALLTDAAPATAPPLDLKAARAAGGVAARS